MRASNTMIGWLQAAPLAIILGGFLVIPIIMIVVVSFWGATEWSIYPAFQFDNYEFLFSSWVTYSVFLKTFKYALVTWALTLLIGFTVAYFSGIPCAQFALANCPIFIVHGAVLDVKHHPYDFLDPVSGPQWHRQSNAPQLGHCRRTA